MSASSVALIGAVCIFGGAMFGCWLQTRLPKEHLGKDSHEIIKLGAGMIATLTALVLGLLVSSAKNSFDAMNSAVIQGGAKMILLDRALAQYGPETMPLRLQTKNACSNLLARIWGSDHSGITALDAMERDTGLEQLQALMRTMKAQTDIQRELLAEAQQHARDLAHTRWLVIESSRSEIPPMLIAVLIFWLTILFVTFGLFAPRNGTVLVVLFVCVWSMSAAIFLVLELNEPIEGLIKVSNAPLRRALIHLAE